MGIGDWLHDLVKPGGTLQKIDAAVFGDEIAAEWRGAHKDATKAIGLEHVLHGLNWVYDNGISQPISTFFMMGAQNENLGDAGAFFDGAEWSRTWRAAENISPGQALGTMIATEKDEARQVADSPLMYARPADSALPAGFNDLSRAEQQEYLRQIGMPAVGNQAIERLRDEHAWFTFVSGATDFTFRWYLDPVVLAGKGVGVAREVYTVKPRPQGGWSTGDIDHIMASSNMGKAQDFLWANKDNPALINNLSMFKKSAIGPRAGGIVASLKSPEEVNLFLRVGLGDVEAKALLMERNAEAAYRLQADTSRLSTLELTVERFNRKGQERYAAMVQARVDELTQQVNANEDLFTRYTAMLEHYRELDAVNLTRYSFSRAQRRTAAQANYRTGPALGTAGTKRGPLATSRIYANDFFGPNLVVVRSFGEAHPNGLMAIDDIHPESVAELRGHLARIPGIGSEIRHGLLTQYLKTTTEGERLALLEQIQVTGVKQVAKRHGFTDDEAMAIYREYQARITGGQERLRRYSAGAHPGEKVHLDEFMTEGGTLTVHPNLVTRLANDHVMIDLKALDKVLKRHGSALKALRTRSLGNSDWMVNSADYFTQLWKFGTLFRLGYIPRVLGDDLAGQVARLGAATMAVRAGWGVRNLATNLALWRPKRMREAGLAAERFGLEHAERKLARLAPKAEVMRAKLQTREAVHADSLRRLRDRHRRAVNRLNALGPEATSTQIRAHQLLVEKHAAEIARGEEQLAALRQGSLQARLKSTERQQDYMRLIRSDHADEIARIEGVTSRGFRQRSQLYREVEVAPGTVLPPSFAGARGEYFQKMISSDDSLRTLLARNKQIIHSNLQRAYGKQGVAISYPQDPKRFVSSWNQAINQQIMQDSAATLALQLSMRGKSHSEAITELSRWLTRTPAGRAYDKRLGLNHVPAERKAASIWYEVNDYLPTSELRMAAVKGEIDDALLDKAAKLGHAPFQVHTTQLGEALAGSNNLSRGVDQVMDWWYKWAASVPADRMSRHPLFNQLYEGHARAMVAQEMKQGGKITQKDADALAEAARRLALKDTRKLVFDIAHRSDAAHALRFMSPFFAATTEAWQRWARIIADRPQVVGYATMLFNAPISMGWMQDADGNKVMRDGTIIDPVTGEKRMVPKSQRYIMARMPKFVADGPLGKALGMDSSGNWLVSQDSMNMITQGDPWFNPGVGPVVSIPVNEFVKDKPSRGELARHLGILPHGPTAGSPLFGNTPLGRAADLSMPQTVKNFMTSFDTTDERYQRVKLHITQKAAWEHANRGKPMPSAKEISEMTRNYWLWSAASAFTQPFATQKPDAYQMFRDQYNNLRRKNPLTADQEFIERFGESYFIFAQAQSENVVGAQATKKAVELSKKYEGLLAEHPDLGALIIGPEGNGPFSPEAYAYQLTHPLVPGGSEMQRRKLSAEEAMEENQRRLGWARFSQLQNWVTSQLHSAGFGSFADAGAEQFKEMKSAIATLLGEPTLSDGSENPYYNEQWSQDYYSLDPRRYERLIPGLTEVAYSDMAKNPNRSDLRSLQTYLTARKVIKQELENRATSGGSRSLGAKKNSDLAANWARFVDSLIEADTRFGDLHHRYLNRDMGVDVVDLLTDDDEEVE
ncbi:hypothetical protein ACFPM3_20205 [Streptomyces coeruleoprunus]|uniref:Large polyvalent protein associated domain-containing protein n=1 Tax=Streptomyces coeruleoprunus TaxID=285563 RepID=A0ABV9XJF5_9ACTN